MRAGLDRVATLTPRAGFLDVSAGVDKVFGGGLGAFVEGDVGWRPLQNVDVFGFAKADLVGVSAGVGARVAF